MNVLIVDDEVIIVTLLKKHIDWMQLGIEQVFTAYTATEARKQVTEHSIDIIVCDIEMPQENGLSFLMWVSQNHPRILRIILTGYPDFKYAQDAISIGVIKYLLKPVSFEELSETIRFAVLQIQKRKLKKQPISPARVNKAPDGYEKRQKEKTFYTHLITDDILPFSDFIDKALAKEGLSREEMRPFGLVYIRLGGKKSEPKNDPALLFALSNIAEELFSDIMELHVWDNIFWVVREKADPQQLFSMCGKFLSVLKGRLREEMYAYFTCHTSLEKLSESGKNLQQAAVQYRKVGQNIYDVDSLMEVMAGEDEEASWSVVEDVQEYIHSHYAESLGRQEIEEALHMNSDYLNRVFKSATGYSLIQYIQYYRVLMARRLIAESRHTVTEVGMMVGFDTPSYFAKIFKKWTGVSPQEYESKVRKS